MKFNSLLGSRVRGNDVKNVTILKFEIKTVFFGDAEKTTVATTLI